MKRCGRCRVMKSASGFSLNRSKKDGLQGICKVCFSNLLVDRKEQGLCSKCGARPPVPGMTKCEECKECVRQSDRRRTSDGRSASRYHRDKRKPWTWAAKRAGRHRNRARKHNSSHPDHPLDTELDYRDLLANLLAHGPRCALCPLEVPPVGWPWEHVSLESGPDVDHILSMFACINAGRTDWISPTNVRLLCRDHHKSEGLRLRKEDLLEDLITEAVAEDDT